MVYSFYTIAGAVPFSDATAQPRRQNGTVPSAGFSMNYFAHALPFLHDPYVAGGTACARLARRRRSEAAAEAETRRGLWNAASAAAVARGVVQHFRDDAQFHGTRAFAETFARIDLGDPARWATTPAFAPAFSAICWSRSSWTPRWSPGMGRRSRRIIGRWKRSTRPRSSAVNAMAPRPTDRLAPMIVAFRRERILWDYLDDARLLARLNQVMRRAGACRLAGRVLRRCFPRRGG